MNQVKVLLFVLLVSIITSGCKKEKTNQPEVKMTSSPVFTSNTSVKLSGEVINDGGASVIERGFLYSKQGEKYDTIYCGSGIGEFSAEIIDLESKSTYVCAAFAKNNAGFSCSGRVSFTTQALDKPTVATNNIINITDNTAEAEGEVVNDGGSLITERGFCWSINQNPIYDDNHVSSGDGVGVFTAVIPDLMANTTYYTRAYAINGNGIAYGQEISFITTNIDVLPSVITSDVVSITSNSAYSGGKVISEGSSAVIARGVCWSVLPNPRLGNTHTTDGMGLGNYMSHITGLTDNKTYYVRAYATNGQGTSYGEQKTFTTPEIPISLPQVTTNLVTNIAINSATCGGNVLSDGGGSVTARGVCWSTTADPTINDSHTSNGSGTGSFVSNITNLTSNTIYYVRSYAKNSKGVSYGTQRTFTTLDENQPFPVKNLTATHQGSCVVLTWDAPISGTLNLIGYIIYRDGTLIGMKPASQRTFSDCNVQNGTCNYCVIARYEGSVDSEEVCVTVTN